MIETWQDSDSEHIGNEVFENGDHKPSYTVYYVVKYSSGTFLFSNDVYAYANFIRTLKDSIISAAI